MKRLEVHFPIPSLSPSRQQLTTSLHRTQSPHTPNSTSNSSISSAASSSTTQVNASQPNRHSSIHGSEKHCRMMVQKQRGSERRKWRSDCRHKRRCRLRRKRGLRRRGWVPRLSARTGDRCEVGRNSDVSFWQWIEKSWEVGLDGEALDE